MTITADYTLIEQIAADIRALAGVAVEDATPFIPNTAAFDNRLVATIETAKVVYFWTVQLDSLTPSQFATQTQRESRAITAYAYMSMSEKPGVPNSPDIRVSDAFATGTATSGSTTTLTDSAAAMTVNAYANTHELWVTDASGNVSHRRILSNTATQFTVRQAFGATIAAGHTYEVWLRPTFWLLWEKAREVFDSLTTNRSQSGKAVTGNVPPLKIEAVTLYEMAFWRASFDMTRDDFKVKSYA